MHSKNRRFLLFLFLLGSGIYLLSHFCIQLYFITGVSMEPSYTSGEPVLIQKWNLPDCLHTNDVIVIHREDLGRDIVKRIVALPGDTVRITDGILYVNGLPEQNTVQLPLMEDAGTASSDILLGPGEYFVLGDNRNASIDSRFDEVGIIYASTITGKVLFPKVTITSE